jgi:diguanylate cyclase (GGDEF)-like protein/PAS domain S-box-containing protein
MTARSRGVHVRSAVLSRVLHPVGVPVGLALLAVALLCGVALVAVHETNGTARRDAQERVQSNRDAAVRALVHQTTELKRSVGTWSTDRAVVEGLRAPTPARLSHAGEQLSVLARSEDSPAAFIADAGGSNVAIYPSQPELLGKNFSFRDWFQGASRTGRPYISSAYISAASGHPLVVGVAGPVLDGSRRVGYVTVLWQLESVRTVAEGAHREDGVTITVTDQRGQPLTGTLVVDDRGQPRSAAVSAMTRYALAGRSTSTVSDSMIQAAGPVPGVGWTVTASLPSSVALAPARSFQRSLEVGLGLALLLVLLATGLGWRFARRRVAEQAAIRTAERALRASEDRFRRVFEESLNGELLVSSKGDVIRVNDTLAALLSREPRWFIGQSFAALFEDEADRLRIQDQVAAGNGELRAEMGLAHIDGRSLRALVALSFMHEHDGGRVLLAQVEDITARRAAEQRLTELALHDELTGLANRRLLIERCEQAFARARSGRGQSTSVAALFIDLDGFKPINDRAGHDTGDQVLVAVAADLLATLRPTDTVARVGGDEFVVLLEADDGLAYLRGVGERVTTTIRRQVSTETDSLTLSASVGIARVDLAREPEVSPEQLLRRADAAMYRAKERGRDQYDVFDSDLLERTEARQELVQAIRVGLAKDRVALVFQPVVDVDSNLVVGVEALMRLRGPDGNLLPTLASIVAAEAAGLAELLGDRVLHLALGEASTWPPHVSLAVNISARELTGRDLRSRVEQALDRHDFDPTRLILEITESSMLSAGPSALAELARLRSRGVRVAIDDFGTAYATLANLTTLPVDILKVDRSFTAGLPHERTHTAIVHGIASMAFELDIPCVIEGVENLTQLDAIRGMSVQAQGWYWGKPQGPGHIPMLNPPPTPAQTAETTSQALERS